VNSRLGGLALIGVATLLAGACGYVVTWLVPRTVGFGDYSFFAVFWSLLFFIIAALSGIQQEVTRASRISPATRPQSRPFRAAALVAGALAILLAATSPAWSTPVFGEHPELAWPVVVGASGYIFVAVSYGFLYGVKAWRLLASLMITEAVVRLIAVAVVLQIGGGILGAAWASAAVIPLTVAVHALWIRRALPHPVLDVGLRQIVLNVSRTIVAAASLGVMVSGLPFVMNLSSASYSAVFGALVVVVTFTRAPIVIVAMALQSYFIVIFRESVAPIKAWLRLLALIVGGGAVLTLLATLFGPALFSLLFDQAVELPRQVYTSMVLSSALIGALTVTGTLLLSRRDHRGYSISWAVAAIATVAVFLIPMGIIESTIIATTVPPALGICVQGTALWTGRFRKEGGEFD